MIEYLIIVVLLILSVISLVNNYRAHKCINRVTKDIENFIENDVVIDFSTSDNYFSKLQNAVNDLEEYYKLQQNNIEKKSMQNTEFISDISHQLKTPIAALRLYCELENAENPNEHTKNELQLIEKMENLIFKLLRLEKIKSDSYAMDFKPESLRALCKEIFDEFKPMFPEKIFSVCGDSELRMDKSWMYEAIANIVKNACEHTDENGKIEISIDSSEKSTNIYLKDNGGGVNIDDLPKLFERFHRTDNASQNSSGIGLAITKAIIEKHHGTISAENSSEGLNIIICLPNIDGYVTI